MELSNVNSNNMNVVASILNSIEYFILKTYEDWAQKGLHMLFFPISMQYTNPCIFHLTIVMGMIGKN